jgi:hypothetical protein
LEVGGSVIDAAQASEIAPDQLAILNAHERHDSAFVVKPRASTWKPNCSGLNVPSCFDAARAHRPALRIPSKRIPQSRSSAHGSPRHIYIRTWTHRRCTHLKQRSAKSGCILSTDAAAAAPHSRAAQGVGKLAQAQPGPAIKSTVGRKKTYWLLSRNWLKGTDGEGICAVLCCAGHNLRLSLSHLQVLLLALTVLAHYATNMLSSACARVASTNDECLDRAMLTVHACCWRWA